MAEHTKGGGLPRPCAENGFGADLPGDAYTAAVWDAANCPEAHFYREAAAIAKARNHPKGSH